MLTFDELHKLTVEYFEPMSITDKQKKEREYLTHVLFPFFESLLTEISLLDRNDDNFYDLVEDIVVAYQYDYIRTFEEYGFDFKKYDEIPKYANDLIRNVVDVTVSSVSSDASAEDDKDYLFNDTRTLNMALNESNKVCNYSEYVDYIEMGYTSKTWYTMEDDKVRETHASLDGATIGIYSLFQVGEAQMRFPMDWEYAKGHLEEIVRCRCSVEYGHRNIF